MPNLTLYGSMTFTGFSTVHLSATILVKICAFIGAPVPLSEYRRMCQNAGKIDFFKLSQNVVFRL